MKTCCSDDKCCNNPVATLTIVRISLGLFYVLFGAMKLFLAGPEAITSMMAGIYNIEGVLPMLLAWAIMLNELIGGIFILLGNKIPRILYKLTLVSFVMIPVVGFLSVGLFDEKNMMKELFFHLQVTLVAVALLFSSPKCMFGLTGEKK